MGYSYFYVLCELEDFVPVRVKRIGWTMFRVEQRLRKIPNDLKQHMFKPDNTGTRIKVK